MPTIGFERCNVNIIYFDTQQDIKETLGIYKKLSVIQDEVIRHGQYRNGRYSDDYMSGVLRKGYDSKIKNVCKSWADNLVQ